MWLSSLHQHTAKNTWPWWRAAWLLPAWPSITKTQLFPHLIWRLLYAHCQTLASWGLGKCPQASLKVQSNGCADYWGLFLWISCAVICTIRTAFSPEAFEEQLQKQIAAAVAAVIAAERKKKGEKSHPKRPRPLPATPTSFSGRQMHFFIWGLRESASSRKIAVSFLCN